MSDVAASSHSACFAPHCVHSRLCPVCFLQSGGRGRVGDLLHPRVSSGNELLFICLCASSPSLFMTCRDSSDTSYSEGVALRSCVLMITQRYRDCCIRGFQLRRHSVESQFQRGGL